MDGHEDRFDRRSGRGRGGRHCSTGHDRDGACRDGWQGDGFRRSDTYRAGTHREDAHREDAWDGLRGGRDARHGQGPRTLYRARDGKLMGVCKGLAQHFGMSVFWVRVLFVAAALFTGFWPVVGLYVLAGLVMKPRPVLQPADAGERDFYGSYVSSRGEALRRLKEKFDRLEGRIRRMEDVVTRRDFDWDRRFGAQR
ncbi:envelope stress response membrane protein PspC [Nitratidesulfovibrio sp. 1201_IL3209]|uniref:envelope stress response membrane protein PspC n=1 Tax=Nitratidesulfovibrio sp. 1201_IL3209 TaxID=3084053 RepID=UPI002FD9A22C